MKHLIAFIIVLVLIHKTLADGDKTNCTKKKDDKFDVEGNTTCPAELLKIIHEYFQTCFPGSNPKIKYDNTSHLSQVAGYWAGQKKLVLKYGEARYAQLGMGAWRQTDIYSRFLDFTADIVGKTVHAFPQYAAPPYTQFKPNEWNVTEEMGIGCWAQESYKTIKKEKKRGISVWVWLFFDLPQNFKDRIGIKNATTTIPPTTQPTTTIKPTTTTTTTTTTKKP